MIAILLLSILSTLLTIVLVVLIVVFLVKRAKRENKIGLKYKSSNKNVKQIMDDIRDLFTFFQSETCKALNTPEAKKELDEVMNETLANVGEEMTCSDAIQYIKDYVEPAIKLGIVQLEENGEIPPKIQNKDYIVDKISSIMVQSVKSSCVDNKIDKKRIREFITELKNAICH